MLLLLQAQSLAPPGSCQVDLLELNQEVPPHGWSANHPCFSPGSKASKNEERDQEGASLRNPKVLEIRSHLEIWKGTAHGDVEGGRPVACYTKLFLVAPSFSPVRMPPHCFLATSAQLSQLE